jgi:Ca2+-binding RTX toxin-like protein
VLSSISYTLPGGVQDLTLTGTGNINGTGNNLDNVIIGNTGNNIITAGSGFDTLTGGGGADTFVFKLNFGKDTITDFHPGQDTIQFDHTNFATPSDITTHANDDGHGNVIISADVNQTVTLQNITTALLQQHLSDFHIV